MEPWRETLEFVSFTQNASQPRTVRQNGREYLVVPITSIVPGVLPGSKGPLYYPDDELSRNITSWDEVPITAGHPLDEMGRPCSVQKGDAFQRHSIGFVRRSAFNGKLQHDGWYDVERVKEVEKKFGWDGLYNKLKNGEAIETSTGLGTDDHPAAPNANFNGKAYRAVARNYRPDHIATLWNQTGACSIKDGCGINVNAAKCQECGADMKDGECPKCGCKHNAEEIKPSGGGGMGELHPKCPSCGVDLDGGKCKECGYVQGDKTVEGRGFSKEVKVVNEATKFERRSIWNKIGRWLGVVNDGNPSDKIDTDKACQILHDKEVKGNPLTDDQRKMFGAACGETKNVLIDIFATNAWSDEARAASAEARKASSDAKSSSAIKKVSDSAHAASERAHGMSEGAKDKAGHRIAEAAHSSAASKHMIAVVKHEDMGHAAGAAAHMKAYEAHMKATNLHYRENPVKHNAYEDQFISFNKGTTMQPLTKEQREAGISGLITHNCLPCRDNPEATGKYRAFLTDLSDEALVATVNQVNNSKRNEIVANAVKDGIDLGDGRVASYDAKSKRFTVNDSKGTNDGVIDGDDHTPHEEGDESERDIDAVLAKGKKTMKQKSGGKAALNSEEQALNEWLRGAPPDAQVAVRNAIKLNRRAKDALLDRMVANVSQDQRASKRAFLDRKFSLDELQELSPLVGNNGTRLPEALSFLINGEQRQEQVVNQVLPEEELLDITVVNFQDWKKEDDRRAAAQVG